MSKPRGLRGKLPSLGSLSELPEFHEPWLTSELKTLSPVCYCLLSYSPQSSPGSGSARFPQPALPGLSEVTSVPQALPLLGYGIQGKSKDLDEEDWPTF